MGLSDIQAAFTEDLRVLLGSEIGPYRLRLGDVHRSVEEQERQIAAGRSWIKHPPTAPHVESRAADILLDELRPDGSWHWVADGNHPVYRQLGEIWEGLSPYNVWGGRFKDGNHFERRKSPREAEPIAA